MDEARRSVNGRLVAVKSCPDTSSLPVIMQKYIIKYNEGNSIKRVTTSITPPILIILIKFEGAQH